MDFDITTVRKLTALRNKKGLDFALKQRLTNLLNTAEEINKCLPASVRQNELIGSFKKQWAEYIEAGGAAG